MQILVVVHAFYTTMTSTWAENEDNADTSQDSLECEQGHGHSYIKKTFHKPTYCHHCTDMLWGLIGQGYVCEGLFSIYLFYNKLLNDKHIFYCKHSNINIDTNSC